MTQLSAAKTELTRKQTELNTAKEQLSEKETELNIAKEQLWNNCLVTLKANRSNYGYVYYVGGNFQP